MANVDSELIDAIHRDQLADIDHPEAKAVCRAIGLRVADEVANVIAVLEAEGIAAAVAGDPSASVQRHSATLQLADADQAIAAARALAALGYRPWEQIDGPAESVLRHFRHTLTIARADDVTMVVDLRWPPTRIGDRLPAVLIPNENDYRAVAFPRSLWPLYLLVRPLRLVMEKLGLRPASGQALGPFLSTPTDLIGPLLDLADVDADDTLVDLGCGDARILRHAVAERGCRGIGVESDPFLVTEARRLVTREGLDNRIVIIEGDANADRLPTDAIEGSVFFLFVPAYSVPPVAARVLAQARPGSRLIIHEQHPLPELAPGIEMVSVPLLSGQGVTVAHRLDVPAPVTTAADRDP
ncbi:MAG: class I SAM-dependent methyltransferase [Acidimicrobiia bacterium]|nr:class I SAM-dependent methyltransferase [Acidimicrobiia bacterium]